MSDKNYVFVEVNGGDVTDAQCLGTADVQVIVLDYDMLETDPEECRNVVVRRREIQGDSLILSGAIKRLQDVIDEADQEEFEENDDENHEFNVPPVRGGCDFGHHANEQDSDANALIPGAEPCVVDPRD